MEHCCEQFKSEVRDGNIVPDERGSTWNVPGCCGGGCYVLVNLTFCPFCGANIRRVNGKPR